MLKRYTLNEEMAKMKHLMLFEAGQPQQQAADPMASYNQTMQNWGEFWANWQQQHPEDARGAQVLLSSAAQANPRMFDQAMRMMSPSAQKMAKDYKKAYETYAKAYEKTSGTKLQGGLVPQYNAQGQITGYVPNSNNPLVAMGATRGINQRTLDQTASAETANDQAWNNLQTAKSAYTADMDNQATNAQNAQNSYYANNSFTLPGVKTYDGKNVVTRDVSVQYDPQRKGFYYMTGANNGTKTWLTNDQVKNLSGNTGYTNYSQGAANAYRNAYQPSQSAQQNYDNALSAYNQASTNYTNALSTPMVNTTVPYSQQQQQATGQQQPVQQQAAGQQQANGQSAGGYNNWIYSHPTDGPYNSWTYIHPSSQGALNRLQQYAVGQASAGNQQQPVQQQPVQQQQPAQQQTQPQQQQQTQPQTGVRPYGNNGSYVSVPTYFGNGPIKKRGIPKIMPADEYRQQQQQQQVTTSPELTNQNRAVPGSTINPTPNNLTGVATPQQQAPTQQQPVQQQPVQQQQAPVQQAPAQPQQQQSAPSQRRYQVRDPYDVMGRRAKGTSA